MRNFKGRIEFMKKTPLENLEKLFLEIYDYGIKDYVRIEKERDSKKSRKEIIINMYKFHDKIRGRKK